MGSRGFVRAASGSAALHTSHPHSHSRKHSESAFETLVPSACLEGREEGTAEASESLSCNLSTNSSSPPRNYKTVFPSSLFVRAAGAGRRRRGGAGRRGGPPAGARTFAISPFSFPPRRVQPFPCSPAVIPTFYIDRESAPLTPSPYP